MSHKKAFQGEDHPSQEFLDNPGVGVPKGNPNANANEMEQMNLLLAIIEALRSGQTPSPNPRTDRDTVPTF